MGIFNLQKNRWFCFSFKTKCCTCYFLFCVKFGNSRWGLDMKFFNPVWDLDLFLFVHCLFQKVKKQEKKWQMIQFESKINININKIKKETIWICLFYIWSFKKKYQIGILHRQNQMTQSWIGATIKPDRYISNIHSIWNIITLFNDFKKSLRFFFFQTHFEKSM